MAPHLVYWAGAGLVSASAAVIVYLFVRVPTLARPLSGMRGLARARALKVGGFFPLIEPAVRFLGGRVAGLVSREQRVELETRLEQAGYYLGLCPAEFLGLQFLGALAGLGLGGLLVAVDMDTYYLGVGAALGFLAPSIAVRDATKTRFKEIDRSLPTAIDLASMSMSAGIDFPGAIREVLEAAPNPEAPLNQELSSLMRELELGRTRRDALRHLARRAPTDAIKEFANAVIQAEEKGTPLADVLAIQAEMARMRRSVLAEEAAAKAGVRMMMPLMMIFGAIFLLLMGPMIVRMQAGGF